MKLETISYTRKNGWSVAHLPAMDSPQTLVIVFGASAFLANDEPIQTLAQAFPQAHLVGCSTAGEIHGSTISDDSLTVAVVQFAATSLTTICAAVGSAEESFTAGETLARNLMSPALRAVLVLSDGHYVNGTQLVSGLNSILPKQVVVTGGLAGDGDRFQSTWVIRQGKPRSGFVSAVGFYGEKLQIGHGSKGGWDIFGLERTVTRAAGNRLYELDGKPALQLYKEYLGERAAGLPSTALLFPLALRADATAEKKIVRTVLGIDEADQSMIFAGDIPSGSLAQLMRANFDRLIDGAAEAALLTKPTCPPNSPSLSLAISCVGRRLILGERAEEELEVTLDAMPAGTRQIGFYSYGEISPYATGHCDLHNQTMTLTTINEG